MLRSKFTKIFKNKLWKNRSVVLQILHHSSVWWDITPLYSIAEILYTFKKRSLSKYKFGELSRLIFCTLMGSFCPNDMKFQLKKVQKSYLSWHWRVMQSLKKNWFLVSNMTWKNWWIFTKLLESLKIWLPWPLFVQRNTEESSFMTMNSDPKFE